MINNFTASQGIGKSTSHSSLITCLIVSVMAGFVFLFTGYKEPIVSDDVTSLATVAALSEKGTLAISEMRWLDRFVGVGATGIDGNLYSKYGIGQVLVALPFYSLGRMIPSPPSVWSNHVIANSSSGVRFALFTNALLGAALVYVTSSLIEAVWGKFRLLSALVLAFASPVFFASRTFGTEIGSALSLVIAVWCCLRKHFTLGMLFVCIAALFRPITIIFSASWLIFLWKRPCREWFLNTMVLGAGVLALAGYNVWRYGTITQTGYAEGTGFTFQLEGLMGFFASPGRSIIYFMPIAVFMISSISSIIKSRNTFLMGILCGIAAFFFAHAMWREWYGGWTYGPRLLIPIIPFIVLVVAPYLTQWIAAPFIWVGYFVQIITLAANPIAVLESAIRSGSTLGQTIWWFQVSPIVLQARALSDPSAIPIIGLLIIVALALFIYYRSISHKQHDREQFRAEAKRRYPLW
jgi:hypothetical protein